MSARITSISRREIAKARINGQRPTIKVVFYDRLNRVFFFHSSKDGHISLPGGGIEDKQTPALALFHEIDEELRGVRVSLARVRRATRRLTMGILPTDRIGWKRKRMYIVALFCKDLEKITNGETTHTDVTVLPLPEAISYVENHQVTPEGTRRLFLKALRKLQKMRRGQ